MRERWGQTSGATSRGANPGLGLVVRPLTRDERKESGIEAGLLVTDVGGAAAAAGIEPGDVILRVNGSPVSSDVQLRQRVAKAGKHLALLVQREDTTLFVPINPG